MLSWVWISKYHALKDYLKQKVTLRGPNRDMKVHKRANLILKVTPISELKAHKLLKRRCKSCLSNLIDSKATKLLVGCTPVVCKFLDIFLKEIPNMPPPREADFFID